MEFRKVDERDKLQFDYAWKWFESAAKQRMILFHYYLIIVGILANAIVLSFKEGYIGMIIFIGIIGIFTSLAFLSFDIRNRGMAKLGEDILEKLEIEVIFPPEFVDKSGNKMGPFSVERKIGMREGQKRTFKYLLLKHKYWIRGMEIIIALFFLFVVIKAVIN